MRMLIVAIAGAALLGTACGPACENARMELDGISACAAAGAPPGYCQCVAEHIYERHSCETISAGNVSLNAVTDACLACAPQSGFTAADCSL